MIDAVKDALRARELIKVSVLKNCMDDPKEIAEVLSERSGSEVVQVIGKKIVLYKKNYELEEKRKRAAKREKESRKKDSGKGKNLKTTGKKATGRGSHATAKQMKWSDR